MEQWWKKTVFYQIYMPSFCDGNGDGIGDFAGITSKLPYLKSLGVGGIWLTPFYPSPKVDQGYDISNYYDIDSDYGTMEDFELFIGKAHSLDIRVISDIVINHTSTEHPWFLESKSSISNPKRDWYIWKEPKDGKQPNNWESFFGGSAWEYDLSTGMYYYHSFAKEQADLNWTNEEVKQEVFQMLDYWVDKGLDGFRLDVINNLTIKDCMKDNPYNEKGEQIHSYDVNQVGIHNFMKELKQHLGQDMFLVGEISSDEVELIHSYVGDGQLDTTFNFNLGSMKKFVFLDFYNELTKMIQLYDNKAFPTLFFGSHDMERFPSRFAFSEKQTKGLFTFLMTCRGIPFLYFGDEIGMRNYEVKNLQNARDIQGILAYQQAKEKGKSEEEAIIILDEKSRDHSRNTMYWNNTSYGGFSNTKPWINFQKQSIKSAELQCSHKDSLFNYVSSLIKLRTCESVLALGRCSVWSPENEVLIIKREDNRKEIISIINFSQLDYISCSCMWKETYNVLIETTKNAVKIKDGKLYVKAEESAVIEYSK